MSTLVLRLFFAVLVATGVVYGVGLLYGYGVGWAVNTCSEARILCGNPRWAALSCAMLLLVYIALRAAGW